LLDKGGGKVSYHIGENVIAKAAVRLIRTQKTDGGWQWDNPDTNPSNGVPTPFNTIGVTALGVLDAYRSTVSADLFSIYANLIDVCGPVYDKMVAAAADPAPSKHRIRGPDIRFLVRLSELVHDGEYKDFAETRWASAKTEFGAGTATGFAQYIRDARKAQNYPALIPWDINLYIVSLKALGRNSEVAEMAEVIYTSLYVPPLDFNMADHDQAEYWLGPGAALDAFTIAKIHSDVWEPLYNALTAGQEPDGHWPGILGGNNNQTTAYNGASVLKSYIAMFATKYPYPASRFPQAVLNAMDYLEDQQLPNGGFEGDPGVENTEVTSEVVQFYNRLPD
jgi:hypothetical protein